MKLNYIFLLLCTLLLAGCTLEDNIGLGGAVAYDNARLNPVAQYHRDAGIDTILINTWQNITFDEEVTDEITPGYSLVNDNQSVMVNFSGIVRLQGKVTVVNNATSNEVQKIALRVMKNGLIENRCTQVSSTTTRGSGNFNTVVITGTSRVEPGDTLELQYQVDNNNLDIWGDPVFDRPVAVSLNFAKISNWLKWMKMK